MPNPRGRQPIAFNQPPGSGGNYPFVSPSEDIKQLVGDFYLSFPSYVVPEVVYPLKVGYMYGFQSDGPGYLNAHPGGSWPIPTHAHDVVVLDANNVVVFDSTTADVYQTFDWDNRLRVVEWRSATTVCRLTYFTEWSQEDIDSGQTRTYLRHIVVEDGELQCDTYEQLSQRVESIQVGLQNTTGKHIVFAEGYNVAIQEETEAAQVSLTIGATQSTKRLVPGVRKTTRIKFDATPGAGLGAFPGCSSQDAVIRTINKVGADANGNFILDAEGCIRTQRPVGLFSAEPREFDYASFVLDPEQAKSAIEFNNDCTNCCDCTYFAQTYQGLKRQWFLHKDLAVRAEASRDTLKKNIARWNAEKAIREADMLRIRLVMDGNSKVRWGVSFCNASKCCISQVKLILTFIEYINGVLNPASYAQIVCLPAMIEGSAQCNGPETIAPTKVGVKNDVLQFQWDYCDPQSNTVLYGRQLITDGNHVASGALKIYLHAAVTWDVILPNPATGSPCTYPEVEYLAIPADVRTLWTARGLTTPTTVYAQKITELTSVDQSNPFCHNCDE